MLIDTILLYPLKKGFNKHTNRHKLMREKKYNPKDH